MQVWWLLYNNIASNVAANCTLSCFQDLEAGDGDSGEDMIDAEGNDDDEDEDGNQDMPELPHPESEALTTPQDPTLPPQQQAQARMATTPAVPRDYSCMTTLWEQNSFSLLFMNQVM